jgi:hypothetical protein
VPYPVAPPKEDDKFDFIRPLIALGLEPLAALRLFVRCGEDTALATAVAALAIYYGNDPEKCVDDDKWLKSACKAMRKGLRRCESR